MSTSFNKYALPTHCLLEAFLRPRSSWHACLPRLRARAQATVDMHKDRAERAASALGSMQRRAEAAEQLANGTQVR